MLFSETLTNVRAVKAIHAKMAAHVLMCLGHSSVNVQGNSLALDAKQVCLQTEARLLTRDFKIRDYLRLDARSPMSGGLDRVWSVVARKLKLSCYTTNYALREIAAVELTWKMSFQKVRDELTYCFADGILDEEEFFLLYDAYKYIYSFWEYDEFSLDPLSSE